MKSARAVSGSANLQRKSPPLSVVSFSPTLDRVLALPVIVRSLGAAGVVIKDAAIRRSTLDEPFLHLTGAKATTAVIARYQQPSTRVGSAASPKA